MYISTSQIKPLENEVARVAVTMPLNGGCGEQQQ